MDVDAEDACRAADDALELVLGVEVEPVHGAEAVAQGRAEQALAGGRADAGEVRQRQCRGAGPHPLPQHGVEPEVLERRVQRLLDDAVEPVDLVDEEDIAGGEVQKDGTQRALVVDGRPRADLDRDPQLVGDDVRERGLSQSGRTTEQHVLDWLIAAARGLEQDAEVLAHLHLAHIVSKAAGAQREVVLVVVRLRVQHPIVRVAHFLPSALSAVASASCVFGVDFQSTASRPLRAS